MNDELEQVRCRWCGHLSPVPSLRLEHEKKCICRPAKNSSGED